MTMNLAQIDLNLLYVLKHLLEEKHVSNTALALNMSQSAVSRSLQKMRVFFDDELLVRKQYGYELTSKAETIKPDIMTVIASLEKLAHKQSFDLATISSEVRFYGLQPQFNDFMPKVIAKVRKLAPNMVVSLDSTPKRHFEALIAGDVHFSLSAHEPSTSEQNIYRMKVASRTFKLLMNKQHPLANQPLTPERLVNCDFGQISLQGEKKLPFDHKFQELGLSSSKNLLSVPVLLSNFSSAPSIAAETDIIFYLPATFAEAACHDDRLITRDIPDGLQIGFDCVYLYWHKRFHDDPMCIWIRSLFKALYDSDRTLT
jgi:DNA-binding transcriptional LysR family regulator